MALVGIARLASQSELLEAKRRVQYFETPSRSILNRTRPGMPRAFVIPGGRVGLLYVVGAPVVMACVALLGSDRFALVGGAIAMALGPLTYGVIAWKRS